MIDNRFSITADATDEIELLLAQFEATRDAGPADLQEFAPSPDDPAYAAVITELARIDLERAYGEGIAPNGIRYVKQFPHVFGDRERRSQLAFEEYRLRRRSGEDVSSTEIATKYDLDGSRWPSLQLGGDELTVPKRTRRFSKYELAPPKTHFPSAGETIAGYRLISRIGEGAYSRVFVARQPDLASRLVVLKVTPLSTAESDRLASLQHSAIVPVYSVHDEGELTCICMPFLGATTLADLSVRSARWSSYQGPAQELVSTIRDRRQSTIQSIRESPCIESEVLSQSNPKHAWSETTFSSDESQGPVPDLMQLAGLCYVDAFVRIVTGAVRGLAYAHSRDVIHRDLKPANILVTDDGNAVLLDFNLAVAVQESKTQVVGGTLPYMSPQQLEALVSGECPDKRDDVFSAGVILYELLTGRQPFKSPANGQPFELSEVIADRKVKPPSVRDVNSMVSPGLESIIFRCLAPRREDRYGDASELLVDLSRHEDRLPLIYASDRSVRERLSKWSGRHPRLSSASSVGAIAVAFLMLMTVIVWQRGEHISALRASAQYESFRDSYPEALLSLSTPGYETEVLRDGVTQSRQLLSRWHTDEQHWEDNSQFAYLDSAEQVSLKNQLAKLAYATANAQLHLARQSPSNAREKHLQEARRWNRLAVDLHPELRLLAQHQLTNRKSRNDIPLKNQWSLDVRAMCAMDSGNAVMWRQLAEQQLDREPTNVSHWVSLALAANRLGDLNSSLSSFDIAVRLLPHSPAIHLNRGICRLDLGDLDGAIEDFSACLRSKPTQMVPRFNRAVAYDRLGQHADALEDLNQLVKLGYLRPRIMLLRAQVYDSLDNRPAGDQDRKTALQLDPVDANDWTSRGVLRLRDSPQAALSDFENALICDPTNASALNNIAHIYAERLNDPSNAIEALTRLIKLRANSASALASRGILYARQGEFDAALQDAAKTSALPITAIEKLQLAGIFAMASEAGNDAVHRANSLRWLARALREDAKLASVAQRDEDLKSLRDELLFRRLVVSASLLASE